MGVLTSVSLSEYLGTIYRPDCEYIDGELLERNVGELDHARLQIALGAYLFNREKSLQIFVLSEQRVQVKPTRFRIPDLLVLTERPTEPIISRPPFLCIEILSPDDRVTQMQERIDDYLGFGVPYVWLIHPSTRRAFIYTRDEVREAKDGVLTTENPEIRVALAEL